MKSRSSVWTVFVFSFPVMLSHACDSLMMFTDRYLLSQVDAIAPTASMSGGMTAFLLWIFGAGLLDFTTPLVAQYVGAKEPEKAKLVVTQGLLLSILLAIPLLLWGESLGTFYFKFLKLPEHELTLAIAYLSIIIKACIFVFMKVTLAGYFSGIGKTKTILGVNMIGLLFNIPVSYFLIHGGFGSEWEGVRGAALGTLCAEILMTLIYFGIYLSSLLLKNPGRGFKRADTSPLEKVQKEKIWKFDGDVCKKLLVFGSPMGAEFLILTFAFNTFLTMFHSFGIAEAQAIMVTFNWSWLTVLPFFGLNIGVMSLVGRAMGEGDPRLAEQITISALKIAGVCVVFFTAVFSLFPHFLIECFAIKEGTPAFLLAKTMIQTLPLYCLFDAISFVLTGTLRASGDAKFCLKVGAIGHWSCLFLSFYGTYYGGFSPITVWSFFILALFWQSVSYLYRFIWGPWRKLQVI